MRTIRETELQTSVPAPARGEADYSFVNNVRFWSMVAIIAVHSICAWGLTEKSGFTWDVQAMMLPILKFGTIGFYLISGFLLGERLQQYPARRYLLRRIRTIGRPWAIWAGVFLLFLFAQITVESPTVWQQLSPVAIGLSPGMVILHTPYWFVPNFIIAMGLLLVFRRFLHDLRFGGTLLAISFFHGINIYFQWIPETHTTAVFGFLFYLWLGHWGSRNFEKVSRLLDRVPYPTLLAAIFLAGLLAVVESRDLVNIWPGKRDGAFNTLRLSNQVFTLLLVLAFVKCRRSLTPSFVHARGITFGQYLLHPICILVFRQLIDSIRVAITKDDVFWANPTIALASWTVLFVSTYGTSLVLARWFSSNPRLCWLVGQRIGSGNQVEKRVAVRIRTPREMQHFAT